MIGSKKYTLSNDALDLYNFVSSKIDKSKYPHLVNPCSEISLNAKGGYCTLASIAPFFCDSLDEVHRL